MGGLKARLGLWFRLLNLLVFSRCVFWSLAPGLNLDQRDACTWIALELNRLGETKIEEGTLATSIRHDLGVGPDFPVFIPAVTYLKSGKPTTMYLMEGYVFVASGLDETAYFALERRPYVEAVMSSLAGPYKIRTLHTIPDAEVARLKKQLRELTGNDIRVNDWVKATEGSYMSLEGRVLEIVGDNASVNIQLKSIKVIATIPRICLEVVEEPNE